MPAARRTRGRGDAVSKPFDQTEPSPEVRERYALDMTLPETLPIDPLPLVAMWLDDAVRHSGQPNPNAMALATCDGAGVVSCRIVLCKRFDTENGFVVFYTNYTSRKGEALRQHPRAAAVFHWDLLDRQVRIEGPVTRSPAEESDAYFATRALESRVGAWASDQSKPIDSRQALLGKVDEVTRRFGVDLAESSAQVGPRIPRPPHWGGYRLWAERVELWLGGPGRIHDRAAWTRSLSPGQGGAEFALGPWTTTRLQP